LAKCQGGLRYHEADKSRAPKLIVSLFAGHVQSYPAKAGALG
jgi:hypothetical protein